jgi:hypothetical protein
MLQRRGITAEWTAANPVLGDGELGYNKTTGEVRMGDGTTAWNTLPSSKIYIPKSTLDSLYSPIGAIPASVADAAGDLVVGTGVDTIGRLAKGTDGQYLSVVGGALTWITPPATDLSSRIPYSLVDAAGDLLVGSGNDAIVRLAKGANGTVLSVDGTGAVVWAPLVAGTVVSVTGAYSVATGVNVVLAGGATNYSVTLPAASAHTNRQINVKNTGTGAITVATSGGNIDGSATAVIAKQYNSLTVVSDGTNWFII